LSSSDEISPQNRRLTGPNSEESPSPNVLKTSAVDSLIQKEKRNQKKKRLKQVQNCLGSIYVCVCVCASRRRNKIELGTKGRRKTGNVTCNSRGREFRSSFHKQAIVLDSKPESELGGAGEMAATEAAAARVSNHHSSLSLRF
jgi:hypothetical protein